MRFTRHARNKLRLYGCTEREIEALIASPAEHGARPDGRPTAVGTIAGTRYRVIYVVEEGETIVITIWDEKE